MGFIAQVSNDFISQLLAHAIESAGSKAAVYRGLPRQEVARNTKDTKVGDFCDGGKGWWSLELSSFYTNFLTGLKFYFPLNVII